MIIQLSLRRVFVFLFLTTLLFQSCGSVKRKKIAKEKLKCTYEEVRFVGIFQGLREGVAQFQRLKGGTEIIVMDSVKITGKLERDIMYRVIIRRSQGGVCDPTTGSVVRM